MDNLMLTLLVVGFVSVFLLVEGAYLYWRSRGGASAQRMQRRLQRVAEGPESSALLLRERALSSAPAAARVLAVMPEVYRLDRLLIQSGLQWTVGRTVAIGAGAAAAVLFLTLLFPAPFVVQLALLALAAFSPIAYALYRRRARLRTLERQLPDTLDLVARALRAGHALSSAIEMVATEAPEPMASEFRTTFQEATYGAPIQQALGKLAERVPLTDLRFFVIAVSIQRETGGNLTELLDKLSLLIRERFKLFGTLRVLTAEGRGSAWVLASLPFVLAFVMYLVNPTLVSVLWRDPRGVTAMYFGIGLMLVGIIWMWRTIQIRI